MDVPKGVSGFVGGFLVRLCRRCPVRGNPWLAPVRVWGIGTFDGAIRLIDSRADH